MTSRGQTPSQSSPVRTTKPNNNIDKLNGHPPPSSSPLASTPAPDAESDKETALREAQEVLEALGSTGNSTSYCPLDGFNLLGVVANPRGQFASQQHYHQQHAPIISMTSVHGGSSGSGGISSTGFGSTNSGNADSALGLHTLELTLGQVTEQIEALNNFFEGWSNYYLGSYDPESSLLDYEPPTTDLLAATALPEEFASLNLTSVQEHVEECGVLSHGFCQRQLESRSRSSRSKQQATSASSSMTNDNQQHDGGSDEEELSLQELERIIPNIFFQSYFDLTDPVTFCELLVLPPDEAAPSPAAPTEGMDLSKLPRCLRETTSSVLHLPPPDFFTTYLDRVELSLLDQVRKKSVAFFHETNRFAQLQEWITGLVQDVQLIRKLIADIREESVTHYEWIPWLDQQRQDFQQILLLLETANEVIRCKSSIGGLLSAQDDLGAAAQIQYGRQLLLDMDVSRVQALSTVNDQLSQYESLVVNNLGEELVEVFLSWKEVTSIGGSHSSSWRTPSTSAEEVDHLHQRVRHLVHALQLCHALTKTSQTYMTRLTNVIRMTVRTTVGEYSTNGVGSMTLESFLECLNLLFEQLLGMLQSAVAVDAFCRQENLRLSDETVEQSLNGTTSLATTDNWEKENESSSQEQQSKAPSLDQESATTPKKLPSPTEEAVTTAADLMSKSISELLRMRKEAHSLVTLDEMKRLWDVCMNFTAQVEDLSSHRALGLRTTLSSQAKAFLERKHESNMSALVAALDAERWTQCEVSAERQASLTRLCSGRAILSTTLKRLDEAEAGGNLVAGGGADKKSAEAEVEGVRYRVVWSSLLLVEMIMTNMACGAHFPSLSTNVVGKIAELLRMFNSRTTQLVLGAGAIHAAARLKSINAKHLALVTQCLGMVLAIFPHVRAALMAQLPPKQHTLLSDIDRIKKDYVEHNEKVLNKFVSIIGGIVEQGLAPRLAGTDFDARAKSIKDSAPSCCVFLEGVSSNVRKMHQVLYPLLPPDHLQDVFSRIFAYLDQKIPAIFIQADAARPEKNGKNAADNVFRFPKTDEGKLRLLTEAQTTTDAVNSLEGVRAWDFTLTRVLERKLDFDLRPPTVSQTNGDAPTDDQPSGASPTDVLPVTTPDEANTLKDAKNERPEVDENGANKTSGTEQ